MGLIFNPLEDCEMEQKHAYLEENVVWSTTDFAA